MVFWKLDQWFGKQCVWYIVKMYYDFCEVLWYVFVCVQVEWYVSLVLVGNFGFD